MKNGHDKVDDVFRDRLGGIKQDLPEGFFEETWAMSEAGKTVAPAKWINPFYYIIPAILVITASIVILSNSASNENATALLHNNITVSGNNRNETEPENISNKTAYLNSEQQVVNNTKTTVSENNSNYNDQKSAADINNVKSSVINNDIPVEKSETVPAEITIPVSVNITNNNGSISSVLTAHSKTEFAGIDTETKTSIAEKAVLSLTKLQSKSLSAVPQFGLDTSIFEYKERELSYYDPQRWSAELSASAHFFSSSIKTSEPELSLLAETRNAALEPALSYYNISLLINYHRKTFFASSGLSYNSFTEHTNYGIVYSNPQVSYQQFYNGTHYDYTVNGNYFQIDSTTYWHYTFVSDSVIHITDSVQDFELDTIPVSVFDSVTVTKFDTADYSKLKSMYSLVEIPLYAGVEINMGKWGYSVSAGLIPGILVKRSGSFFDGNNEVTMPSDIFPMRKFILSGGLKAQFNYYPNTKFMIFAGPEFKTLLINASEKGSGFQQKWIGFGLRGGIRYFFN